MKDAGFFVAFFAVIIFLAVMSAQRDTENVSGGPAEQSSATDSDTETYPESTNGGSSPSPVYEAPAPQTEPALTEAQMEQRVASLYNDLNRLKEDVRVAKLTSPESPYKGLVNLTQSNAYTDDPDREYLTLSVNWSASTPINISNWYVRSYVTDEVALIPQGDRYLLNWRNPNEEPIVLGPGESAYLITGKSPIDGSFKENMCSGYIAKEEDFFPSLSQSCPYPRDEMKRFGTNIDLDDDECYTFVESLSSCTEPDEDTYTRRKVGSACQKFIENTFNYRDCVRLHRYDPYFSRQGTYWHVYLGERNELWRPRREIIQLMDENDRVVDVVEY